MSNTSILLGSPILSHMIDRGWEIVHSFLLGSHPWSTESEWIWTLFTPIAAIPCPTESKQIYIFLLCIFIPRTLACEQHFNCLLLAKQFNYISLFITHRKWVELLFYPPKTIFNLTINSLWVTPLISLEATLTYLIITGGERCYNLDNIITSILWLDSECLFHFRLFHG